ncbi:hypothetical protein ISU10_03090 [Nocardioides agariphilus]|uniref:Uncharacterized protein n=1 Tax=Nocardioides agariphilus TaxID=433664 RepID=A0A930VMU8_9ACTN|nr:hypothetical protein [Nocardioides agariphilus]MBF4766750.1 hypothetical protein [Nocardioides agariphilus]
MSTARNTSHLAVAPGVVHHRPVDRIRRPGAVFAVTVPTTPLLARALSNVTWSDAYAVALPTAHHPFVVRRMLAPAARTMGASS